MAERAIVPVDALVALLDEFGQASLDGEEQAFARLMNVLEARAVELTPVETGNLESSTVVRVQKRGDKLVGTLAFATPYAATVHELPPNSRGPRTRVKPGNDLGWAGPKYLERPLRDMQTRMSRDLGKALREIWGGTASRARRRGRRRR